MIESPDHDTIVLRRATLADSGGIARVAQLDTRPVPPGPHLVAERDGRIEAAISLRTHELVANPFSPTAHLCGLLRLRAAEGAAETDVDARRDGLRPQTLGAPA